MTEKNIAKLVDDVKSSIARTHDLVLQLEAAVRGENPTRDGVAFWCSEWKGLYRANFDITKADAGNFKRLITSNGLAEMKLRVGRYLADKDRFLVQQKHPLSIFFKRVSAYATPQGTAAPVRSLDSYELPDEPPADCRHEPPCRGDIEHTQRRAREMRA